MITALVTGADKGIGLEYRARMGREADRLTFLPARERTDDPHGP